MNAVELLAAPSDHKASFWKRNNIQMNATLRWLLSNLSMPGLIERLREAGALNSLADICCGWFQSAD